MMLFLAILSICFVTVTAPSPSTLAMVTLGVKEYYFSELTDEQRIDWKEAKKFCNSYNLNLAAFETREEHILVTNYAKNVLDDDYTFWVDGTDEKHEGRWKWSSSSLDITYNAWGRGQPGTNAAKENCMGINPHEGINNWHDIPCAVEFRFICESRDV